LYNFSDTSVADFILSYTSFEIRTLVEYSANSKAAKSDEEPNALCFDPSLFNILYDVSDIPATDFDLSLTPFENMSLCDKSIFFAAAGPDDAEVAVADDGEAFPALDAGVIKLSDPVLIIPFSLLNDFPSSCTAFDIVTLSDRPAFPEAARSADAVLSPVPELISENDKLLRPVSS